MPMYRVVTPLRNGGPEPIEPGEEVELTRKEGDALVLLGAVERIEGRAAPASPPALKPLAKMTKAELAAIVADEQVEVAADATNAQIAAAIEAKRAQVGQ